MPQITSVTSEALQATIRRLLTSQQGFGDDLQATNLITPIIDLTPTAEGSSVPEYLQRASSHGSSTPFDLNNTTTTLVTGGGFYQVIGTIAISNDGTTSGGVQINDGSTTKVVYQLKQPGNSGNNGVTSQSFDFVVFLEPTDALQVTSNSTQCIVAGSFRQIANSTGVLVNPVGFTPQ